MASAWNPLPAPLVDRMPFERQFTIPTGYGDDRIILMVKDPWWLYAYWEVQPSMERAGRSQLSPEEIAGSESILRVYDMTGVADDPQPQQRLFDITLSGMATNWYIHVNAPNRSFIVDLGILARTGRFITLVRSNRVTTPRAAPSDVLDEAWVVTDEAFWKLLQTARIGSGGASSMSGAQLLAQQAFSPGWSSMSAVPVPTPGVAKAPAAKAFWCRIDTDLVIYGATEPRATVQIQGQAVRVRKDGTFSLRMALPEGTHQLTIHVTSADGQHTQDFSPLIARSPGDASTGRPAERRAKAATRRNGPKNSPAP